MASTFFPLSPRAPFTPPPRYAESAQDLSALIPVLPASAASGTPERKRGVVELGTPSPVRNMKTRLSDLAEKESLNRGDQAVVEDALQSMKQLPDTPERCVRSRQTSLLMKTLAATVFSPQLAKGEEVCTSSRTCIGLSAEKMDIFSGSWSEQALAKLSEIYLKCSHRSSETNPVLVVNLGHLVQPSLRGQVAVGFHMSSPENRELEEKYQLRTLAINPMTGVRALEYQMPGARARKISTFFPGHIQTPEALLAILAEGKIIRQGHERCLMSLPSEKYHVELYLRSNFHVHSCFPVFYYAAFDPDASYQITETILLSADTVLKYCRMIERAKILYRLEKTEIIDIAPCIENCPMQKGIYIEIATSYY